MRFLVDEDLPRSAALNLRQAGHRSPGNAGKARARCRARTCTLDRKLRAKPGRRRTHRGGHFGWQLGYDALRGAGVVYRGMEVLGAGAILVGMILGAICVFVVDRKFREASYYALFGAVCSFFGVIHPPGLGLGAAWQPAIGYALMALVCYLMAVYRPSENALKLSDE